MVLDQREIAALIDWRRTVHQWPEISGEEAQTAATVVAALHLLAPDEILTKLGGHGVAAVFAGREAGPTVLFRCELDALPIAEIGDRPHRSRIVGKAHLCGHDGHMAIILGLAQMLAQCRPRRGRVVVLFQPAEETGAGARAVIADPQFVRIRPDFAFALHNMPGIAMGAAAVNAGPMACASRGLRIVFAGKTAHAAMPETGVSPAPAIARLIPALTALGTGGPLESGFRLVTVTHARFGEPAFGIAPGEGELWVTLRTVLDRDMAALHREAMALIDAEAGGLGMTVTVHDQFAGCDNDPEAGGLVTAALDRAGITLVQGRTPMRASEDFGLFGSVSKAALLLLGAGESHAALHNPDYDFPDEMIAVGIGLFDDIGRQLLG
ncbi:amidohydrolase [Devosia sp.]|uniref:amidohydrolase n=1 Tax=Devosia sp. TaxID=1871048 RepID=UPI003266EF6C